jgi:DNA polymerase-3 subunit delta'
MKNLIIGNRTLVNYLQRSIKDNSLQQAYLFIGPAHLGKTLLAEQFARWILCHAANPDLDLNQAPCGHCLHCQQLKSGFHPDIFWVKREKNEKTGKLSQDTRIDQIRDLQEKLALHPFLNAYKFAIIEEADSLNEAAYNSLLKTLEEPAPKTILILLSKQLQVLPETIKSRCQTFFLQTVPQAELAEHLSQTFDQEKAQNIASLAFGRPGRACWLSESDNWQAYLTEAEKFLDLFNYPLAQRFAYAKDLLNDPDTASDHNQLLEKLENWQFILRDMILTKIGLSSFIHHQALNKKICQSSQTISLVDLWRKYLTTKKAGEYLKQNINPQLILETILLI